MFAAMFLFAACGGKAPAPQSSDEIFKERVNLPALYFTGGTHRRVIAPGSKGTHADAASKEICWLAFACHNPQCPGKGKDGAQFLFITIDPAIILKADGTLGFDATKMAHGGTHGTCPECLKKRKLDTESKAARQQYVEWARPHVLPETAKRQKELERELAALLNKPKR